MPLQIPAILRDKRAQVAAGVGAVAGVVVLMRNKNANTEDAAGTATTGGTAGAYDSSSTDAYNNLQTSLDNQLGEFRGELTDLQDQLGKIPTGGTTVPPAPKPVPKPPRKLPVIKKPIIKKPVIKKPVHPVKKPKPPSAWTSYKVRKGDTLSELAKRDHTTVAELVRLNRIKNPNLILAGTTLKIPKKK